VVQGSVAGPTCFTVFIDSLLQALHEVLDNSFAYADDLKFVSETSDDGHCKAQAAVSLVEQWSEQHHYRGTNVMCCTVEGTIRKLYIPCKAIVSTMQFKDLGVHRSPNATYSEHINSIADAVSQRCGPLLHVFRTRNRSLLWAAF
jgi:hypothetical protein